MDLRSQRASFHGVRQRYSIIVQPAKMFRFKKIFSIFLKTISQFSRENMVKFRPKTAFHVFFSNPNFVRFNTYFSRLRRKIEELGLPKSDILADPKSASAKMVCTAVLSYFSQIVLR